MTMEKKEKCFQCGKKLDTVRFWAIIDDVNRPFCDRHCYVKRNTSGINLKIMVSCGRGSCRAR